MLLVSSLTQASSEAKAKLGDDWWARAWQQMRLACTGLPCFILVTQFSGRGCHGLHTDHCNQDLRVPDLELRIDTDCHCQVLGMLSLTKHQGHYLWQGPRRLPCGCPVPFMCGRSVASQAEAAGNRLLAGGTELTSNIPEMC